MSQESDKKKEEIRARLAESKWKDPYRLYADLPQQVRDMNERRKAALNACLTDACHPEDKFEPLTAEQMEAYDQFVLRTAQMAAATTGRYETQYQSQLQVVTEIEEKLFAERGLWADLVDRAEPASFFRQQISQMIHHIRQQDSEARSTT